MSFFKGADRRKARSLGKLTAHASTRHYDRHPHRWLYLAAIAVMSLVLVFSATQLILYAMDYASSQRVSDDLRDIYYASETSEPTAAPAAAQATAQTTAENRITAAPAAQPTDRPKAATVLPKVPYPLNPYGVVSERFSQLRRQNIDIVGWLTVPGLIDQAVVQRDNEYYLRRDYLGRHNNNGALFLDETCNTSTRPYTLMIYGHNMQSGAMFGSLRNYEHISFFRDNPFITFDTAWEQGRYVVFAVGTVSTGKLDKNYVDFGKLMSSTVSWRDEAIGQLVRASVFTNVIDVRADDQLLLLITCVDDDEERRVLCARRIRDGESEEALRRQLSMMWTK